jgi:hypothetical protein
MGRNEFWRKHPALEMVFFAVVTVGWFTVVIAIVAAGRISFGRGANAVQITTANDPIAFSAIIGVMTVLGIAAPAYNLPRIIRTLQNQRSPEDSDPPATQS